MAPSTRVLGGPVALVLYDCTTLYFKTVIEDKLRRVGMIKEHRLDSQIQVGPLVDPSGFPFEVHCFEGNAAATKTLIPALRTFADRHGITGRRALRGHSQVSQRPHLPDRLA